MTAEQIVGELSDEIRESTDEIIDEINDLSDQIMDVHRGLTDQIGVGLGAANANDLYLRVRGGQCPSGRDVRASLGARVAHVETCGRVVHAPLSLWRRLTWWCCCNCCARSSSHSGTSRSATIRCACEVCELGCELGSACVRARVWLAFQAYGRMKAHARPPHTLSWRARAPTCSGSLRFPCKHRADDDVFLRRGEYRPRCANIACPHCLC